jgi:Transglutaminase-like superfamily
MAIRWKHRIARLPLVLEALCYLAVARTVIRFLPFAFLTNRIRAPSKPAKDLPPHTINSVCAAVSTASNRLAPWAVCLPQAVAGHWMLRRRGVASVVCFGAGRDPNGGLGAHAWLKASDQVVLGGKAMAGFTPVAEFPPSR